MKEFINNTIVDVFLMTFVFVYIIKIMCPICMKHDEKIGKCDIEWYNKINVFLSLIYITYIVSKVFLTILDLIVYF